MEKLEKFQVLVSCVIITLGVLVASIIFAGRIPKNETITVTGSAYKIVKSDVAKLTFSLGTLAPNQMSAYKLLRTKTPKVVEYLVGEGIKKEDINIRAMQGYNVYKLNSQGYNTNIVEGYNANQYIEVTSNDVEKIKDLSSNLQQIAGNGVTIDMQQPEFYYSDLSSIKVDLLKEASEDAKLRADSMLKATGARVGKVKSMKMGVFQITPPTSTSVSDMGISDTTSIDKKVTAVSNVVFKVR